MALYGIIIWKPHNVYAPGLVAYTVTGRVV
jgi:hypothetical protein